MEDPAYALGLRRAVSAGLEFAIACLQGPPGEPVAVPEAALAQARAAARNEISLDVVIRRYSAGYTLLGDFLLEDAGAGGGPAALELRPLLRSLSVAFERLVAAVACAYSEEAKSRFQTAERRRGEWVRKLLAGDLVDPEQLGYQLEHWHLGALACGAGALESLRTLAKALDRSLLLVRGEEETAWAWLGGRARPEPEAVLRLAERALPEDVRFALGEPGRGIEGWRLTHRQAKAAMAVALRGPESRVRYFDVALLAAALRDDVLEGSLREVYLGPLRRTQDRGAPLIETLHAYFACGRNATSAAAALGVSRQTVSVRLRAVEEKIGRPLATCGVQLEMALRLQDMTAGSTAASVDERQVE